MTIGYRLGLMGLAAAATLMLMAIPDARAHTDELMAGAKAEGQLVSYGMSDDWVNFENVFKAIETKYGVKHTDTDMTSAEEITHLMAERGAPVMDIADIGYDFVGRLLENNLAEGLQEPILEKNSRQFQGQGWTLDIGLLGCDQLPDQHRQGQEPSAGLERSAGSRNTRTWSAAEIPGSPPMRRASVLAAAYANGGGEGNVQPGLDWFKALRDTGNLRKGVVSERRLGPKRRMSDRLGL